MSRKLILIPRRNHLEGTYSAAEHYGLIPEDVTFYSDKARCGYTIGNDKITIVGILDSNLDSHLDNFRGCCFDSTELHLDVIPLIDDYLLQTIKL